MSAERLRVVRVGARPLDLELTEPFGIATGAQMALRNVLVEVELACGAIGIGEAAPFPAVSGETQAGSLAAIRRLGPELVGRFAFEWRPIATSLARAAPAEPSARSGIEQAVLDALARALEIPARALYGGGSEPLRTDLTITTGDVAHAKRSAAELAGAGFSTMKMKVGGGPWAADAERVVAAHDAAPACAIVLDANGGLSSDDAIALARDLAARGIDIALFEQPVAPADLPGLARVRAATGLKVCADESARSAADVIALVRAGACDGVNVKIMKTGIVEALAIVDIAKAAGLSLMIGGMVESEIAMLHSAHLASGVGGFTFVDLDTPLFLRDAATVEGYPCRAGAITLDGSAPGIGVHARPTEV